MAFQVEDFVHRHQDRAIPLGLIGEEQATISDGEVIPPNLVGLGARLGAQCLFGGLELYRRLLFDLLQEPSGRLPRKPLQLGPVLKPAPGQRPDSTASSSCAALPI